MDCVHQLIRQYPCHFEFNEDFLIEILDHLYSCKFGTFLLNCEKERVEASLSTKTKSLWTFINHKTDEFINPFFAPALGVLKPSSAGEDIFFWRKYYTRW